MSIKWELLMLELPCRRGIRGNPLTINNSPFGDNASIEWIKVNLVNLHFVPIF